MTMKAELTEEYMVEKAAINWLKELGYSYIHGSELSPENGGRILQTCCFKEKDPSSNKKNKSLAYRQACGL